MLETLIGCLKWAAVGFVVAFFLMRLYEASHIHDDIPKPEFKIRQSKRAALVLSTFAAMLSALVWLLVQKLGSGQKSDVPLRACSRGVRFAKQNRCFRFQLFDHELHGSSQRVRISRPTAFSSSCFTNHSSHVEAAVHIQNVAGDIRSHW
jgi:hypothetical protein